MSPDDPRHGSNGGYLAHITARDQLCDPCREAHNAARRNLWRKRYLRGVDRLYVDATGTVRRIRALQALGWRYADIDAAVGHAERGWAHNLTAQDRVHVDTAEKVQAAFEQLAMTRGPSERVRRHAARMGWAPPLAWDDIDDPAEQPNIGGAFDDQVDPVVVDRLLAGQQIPSNRAEKTEAMRRWRATGRSERSLCELHGWKTGRYVTREAGAA